MTHYEDLMQKMTVEEMARIIEEEPRSCERCVWENEYCFDKICAESIKKWLLEDITAHSVREDPDGGEKEKQMDRDAFLKKAKRLGARALNDMVPGGYDLNEHDMYIVWYCKTLQNWKALAFTDVLYDDQDVQIPYYVEVTYNGDKHEAYCDVYLKQKNFRYPDGDAK